MADQPPRIVKAVGVAHGYGAAHGVGSSIASSTGMAGSTKRTDPPLTLHSNAAFGSAPTTLPRGHRGADVWPLFKRSKMEQAPAERVCS